MNHLMKVRERVRGEIVATPVVSNLLEWILRAAAFEARGMPPLGRERQLSTASDLLYFSSRRREPATGSLAGGQDLERGSQVLLDLAGRHGFQLNSAEAKAAFQAMSEDEGELSAEQLAILAG